MINDNLRWICRENITNNCNTTNPIIRLNMHILQNILSIKTVILQFKFNYPITLIIGKTSLRYCDIYIRFSIVNSFNAIDADWINSGLDKALIHKCIQFFNVSCWWPNQLLYCPERKKQYSFWMTIAFVRTENHQCSIDNWAITKI